MAVQDEGSSSAATSSSTLQCFPISPTALAAAATAGGTPPYPPWLNRAALISSDERGLYLIHFLQSCANFVAAGNFEHANACLDQTSSLASPDGDSMQRIASLFTEALARRLLRFSLPGVLRALTAASASATAVSLHHARRHFFDLCPFLRLAFVIANQAILEAMEGEQHVHVVDLHAADPAPGLYLLQCLAARPEGPPHLQITGVHDQKEILDRVSAVLSEEAEKLDVAFQFHPVVSKLEHLDPNSLRGKPGEAIAVISVLQLHRLLAPDNDRSNTPHEGLQFLRNVARAKCSTQRPWGMQQGTLGELFEKDHPHMGLSSNGYSPSPDSGVSSSPAGSAGMEAFLEAMWKLSPKVMVVAEQESNHNSGGLRERFTEALHYYAALFDCLESTVARGAAEERKSVEKTLLGEEVRDIIACEGSERRERHERLERWVQRMEAAGFGRVSLSYYGQLQARRLLQEYYGSGAAASGYKVREEHGGCFLLCWQSNPLFSVSAWRCRRFD